MSYLTKSQNTTKLILIMNIEKCSLSIETTSDNPFHFIKVSCYQQIDDVMKNPLESGNVHGNMDLWLRYDDESSMDDITSYREIGVFDEWIRLEPPAYKVDALIILDSDDPQFYESFFPALLGKKEIENL
jgi:hypothetical protein